MQVRESLFHDAAGPALRALAAYDRTDLELLYEREDVATKDRVVDDIHEELIFGDLGSERLEALFQVGDWHCTMHRFERAICIHYGTGDFQGVLVSVDTDAGVDLEAVVQACESI